MNDSDKKIATKEALLEAAKELFTLKGYSAVSTRELADKAGVNLGSIQYHFGSKANLFVDTTRELMGERKERLHAFTRQEVPSSKEDAAVETCKFINALLEDMLDIEGPDACRLMHREILGATSQDPELFELLVTSITDEFIKPLDDYLSSLLSVVSPKADTATISSLVNSVVGQCVYYVTHKPFLERLSGRELSTKESIQNITRQISEFSLRGLSLEQQEVERALANAFEGKI